MWEDWSTLSTKRTLFFSSPTRVSLVGSRRSRKRSTLTPRTFKPSTITPTNPRPTFLPPNPKPETIKFEPQARNTKHQTQNPLPLNHTPHSSHLTSHSTPLTPHPSPLTPHPSPDERPWRGCAGTATPTPAPHPSPLPAPPSLLPPRAQVLCASKRKPCINVALGFDTFVVMRHGLSPNPDPAAGQNPSPNPAAEAASGGAVDGGGCRGGGVGPNLGCYFCNDVVAPMNSTRNRTLDQQCTATRPGLGLGVWSWVVGGGGLGWGMYF
jgi:hypothetical protein